MQQIFTKNIEFANRTPSSLGKVMSAFSIPKSVPAFLWGAYQDYTTFNFMFFRTRFVPTDMQLKSFISKFSCNLNPKSYLIQLNTRKSWKSQQFSIKIKKYLYALRRLHPCRLLCTKLTKSEIVNINYIQLFNPSSLWPCFRIWLRSKHILWIILMAGSGSVFQIQIHIGIPTLTDRTIWAGHDRQ